MLRRVSSTIAAATVVLSGLAWGAAPASAANTRPTDATYGASAAVDVSRSPGYPACTSNASLSSWSVTSTGNPISQSAYNDTNNFSTARVDLSNVSYWNGSALVAAPAVLKVVDLAAGTPATFALRMYLASAPGTTEILWDPTSNRWALTGAAGGTQSFSTSGYAFALYSGGFMHEGIVGGSGQYEIGTFLLIDDTLPTGVTLQYTPSPHPDNVCSSSKTYATVLGMASTNLGGSGIKTSPSGGVGSNPSAPVVTINIDGNGGRCTTPAVTGVQGTWTTAPASRDCTRAGFTFTGFNTAANGSGIAIAPGGNLNLTTDNTLYAQYSQPRLANAPSNVVATPGLKKVTVTWKAPSDPGTGPINGYLVKASPGTSSCVTNLASANMLECTYTNLAPGTNYTFSVQALNQAGWGAFSAASNVASPYDLKLDSVSRPEVKLLFINRGSRLEATGRTPGLAAGTVLTPVMQIGTDGAFVPLTKDTTKVNGDSAFSWSRKLDRKDNGKPVSVYFTYANAKTSTLTAKLGATVGLASAPRDVKVTSGTSGFTVSWKPPARDGGSPISEYVMTSDLRAPTWAQSKFVSCTVKAPATTCTMPGSVTVFDPNKTYTFSVVAKTERGTSPQATKQWKGELYRLNIFKRARVDSEVLLSFSAVGWSNDTQSFEVQAKVGENGAWKKQGMAQLDPEYVDSIGDWQGMLPKSSTAGSTVFYRLKSNKGFSNEVRFRLSSSFEYSFG